MILAGHQPVYLPGIIFFNKIALCDRFMYVGHVQFNRKSWQQRNRIAIGDRELFLSVPVRKSGRFDQPIDETEIEPGPWRRKHLGSIRQAYGKRPYFHDYFPEIEAIIGHPWRTLGELNRALVAQFVRWLAIATPFVESYDYGISAHKTGMLIEMCRALGADRYLSNEGARAYVEEDRMAEAGIIHCWQVFEHPVYDQGRPFIPNLSIIDLLLNAGPEAGAIVRRAGWIRPCALAVANGGST
jgi:WbqC-like protein family